jgi:tetratricopeptide (TPR) repeat protein/mono/diheme cytochrome c family protein
MKVGFSFAAALLGSAVCIDVTAGFLPGATATVTYYKQIAPILFDYCAPCHRPGESGPFSLLTYTDARKRAAQIAAVTQSRYMPPWLPDPGYGDFADQRRLSEQQIASIARWVAGGAVEGNPGDSPPEPAFTPGWQLGPPDLVIRTPRPFRVPPDGPDLFWNFVLAPEIQQSRFVKAIEIRPGNAQAVHHANMLVDRVRSANRGHADSREGFPGMDLVIETETFDPDSHFLFWKPGGKPWVEPAGMAWRLDPGNNLILNVHFKPTGKTELVQPSVGLYFTSEPQTKFPILIQLEHDGTLNIPPGDRDFQVSDEIRLPTDVDVIAVYPHAHYLGHLLEGFATLPDGSRKWLIRISNWDLNWQSVYRYRVPVFLPKGTTISMCFHYDNSAANPRNPNSPPKRILAGDQSTDEMGHLWLQVLPRGGDQRILFQEAMMRRRLEKYPADFSAYFNLGALYFSRKNVPLAISYLERALQFRPEEPVALNTLGAALAANGRSDQALEKFEHALRIQPDYTSALFNLGDTLAAKGRFEEAVVNFHRVLAADPRDRVAREHLIAALNGLADSADARGNLTAAASDYREVVALDPLNVEALNNLGVILARLGDIAGAIEEFKAALKVAPTNQAARDNLERAQNQLSRH